MVEIARRTANPIRALVQLAIVALRRTAAENSANLLGAVAVVLPLADGAWRVRTPEALDRWLVAAIALAVVLPVAVAGNDPLRSMRLRLLPVPSEVLGRARVIASAPLRLPLAASLLLIGTLTAGRVAGGAAGLSLVGWSVAAFFAAAVLEEYWHRPRAIVSRVLAGTMVSFGMGCLWSLRGTASRVAESVQAFPLPALLPRGGTGADWVAALALVVVSATVGVAVLTQLEARSSGSSNRAREAVAGSSLPEFPLARVRITDFPRALRPRVAQEVALLSRHVGPRIALAFVAVLACAATYGRVPGLALVAAIPMILLTANALGADVTLAGVVRHGLHPEPFEALRNRRLAVWSAATAIAAALGSCVGLVLPVPSTVGQPTSGAYGAPAMLLYAATLVPWFGRASWWWAQRYPQPSAQRLREVGPAVQRGPTGPAHLAIVLYVAWAGVALIAALLWAVSYTAVRQVVEFVSAARSTHVLVDPLAFLGATVLAAGVASAAHVVRRAKAWS